MLWPLRAAAQAAQSHENAPGTKAAVRGKEPEVTCALCTIDPAAATAARLAMAGGGLGPAPALLRRANRGRMAARLVRRGGRPGKSAPHQSRRQARPAPHRPAPAVTRP